MARAIIRFSLNDDHGSTTRNAAAQLLTEAGFSPAGTSVWEGSGGQQELSRTLSKVLTLLGDPPRGGLDHVWIYVDRQAPPTVEAADSN